MKLDISILVVLLILCDTALGAVGDAGVTDGISAIQPGKNLFADNDNALQGTVAASYQVPQMSSNSPSQNLGPTQGQGFQSAMQDVQGTEYAAPQTAGPYQEKLSAEDLRFAMPQAESFQPDSSMNFASATPPTGLSMETYGTGQGTGSWYYPGLSTSDNRLYVQTAAGLKTVAACGIGGYLPLWADIGSAGNFYIYEWYPSQHTPVLTWGGWTWPGFKKGWFEGDVSGWHILCYNCRDWSNYIYIYVYPGGTGAYGTYGTAGTSYSAAGSYVKSSLPAGAPTPPDPGKENLALPDYNLLTTSPSASSYGSSSFTYQGTYPAQTTFSASSAYSGSNTCTACQGQTGIYGQSSYPASNSGKASCPGCEMQDIYKGSYPVQEPCSSCSGQSASAQPPAQIAQNYKAVFPNPSICKCNEYYMQTWPNKLSTVGSVKCNGWLPLWSKVSRPGTYWSFEWTMCGAGNYCSPDVKNFGSKGPGWYQTWFRDYKLGWHILCYYCNDWSNYVYVYVWPAS